MQREVGPGGAWPSSCNVALCQSLELFVYAMCNDMILHISPCLIERRFGVASKHVIALVNSGQPRHILLIHEHASNMP
jgi:hypothetical protein